MQNFLRRGLGVILVSTLIACGGGGGSGSVPPDTPVGGDATIPEELRTTAGIIVTPDLGAFNEGALVTVFDAATGQQIGSPKSTVASGSVALELGGATGSLVIRVQGADGVTYFDEGLGLAEAFGSSDQLWSVIPASEITNGAHYSVNLLTDMAAAYAGVTVSNQEVVPTGNDTVEDAVYKALARARYAVGLGPSADESIRKILNPLGVGDPVASTTDKVDTSKLGGYLSLGFSEVARAVTNDGSLSSMKALAQALRASIVTEVAGGASLSAAGKITLVWQGFAQTNEASADFFDRCSALKNAGSLRDDVESVFGNANSGAVLSPSDAQVATLVEQLRSVIRDQNRKALPNALASEKLDPSCS